MARLPQCMDSGPRGAVVELYGADATALRFVARALSDDKTRPMMTCLMAEEVPETETEGRKARIYASDGRRLHSAIISEPLEAGLYAVVSPDKKRAALARLTAPAFQFPNVHKVIPGDPGSASNIVEDGAKLDITGKLGAKENGFHTVQVWLINAQVRPIINFDYLADLEPATYRVMFTYNPKLAAADPERGIRFDSVETRTERKTRTINDVVEYYYEDSTTYGAMFAVIMPMGR